MEKFDVEGLFNSYTENLNLEYIDILHIYDTQDKCIENNRGYHDSRFFTIIGFNTETKEKITLTRKFDGIYYLGNVELYLTRVFYDGSTLLRFKKPYKIEYSSQVIYIES